MLATEIRAKTHLPVSMFKKQSWLPLIKFNKIKERMTMGSNRMRSNKSILDHKIKGQWHIREKPQKVRSEKHQKVATKT